MSDLSRSNLYGAGVFTTIRIIDGEPWLWDKHWRRLESDAAKIGIDLSMYSEYMVRRGLDESIPDVEKTGVRKARIMITDERPSPLWSEDQRVIPTNVSFLIAPLPKVARPFRLTISPYAVNSTSPLAGVKTCNYLEETLSLDEAKSRGYNEAVRLNERGHVTSACMANIFWLKDDRLFTSDLSTGCLPGTTREFVMESLDVTGGEVEVNELKRADAIFLTSAGLGVVQVDEFDQREMATLYHPIRRLVQA
ncbi:MAG: aminotransferase class IV [Acidobacteria bacterium]|nr:aminotransferase class IV [Acidobacteriota bacterium]